MSSRRVASVFLLLAAAGFSTLAAPFAWGDVHWERQPCWATYSRYPLTMTVGLNAHVVRPPRGVVGGVWLGSYSPCLGSELVVYKIDGGEE